MKVNVAQLLDGTTQELELDFDYEPAERLDEGTRLLAPVAVHLEITGGRRQLWLQGRLDARLEFTCDRCLKPFERQLTTHYAEEYLPRGKGRKQPEQDDGEVRSVYYSGTELDVTEGLRQNLLLMLPTKRICSENCRGLCPYCGKDLNEGDCDCEVEHIDPRLEILKKLRFNDADEGSVT